MNSRVLRNLSPIVTLIPAALAVAVIACAPQAPQSTAEATHQPAPPVSPVAKETDAPAAQGVQIDKVHHFMRRADLPANTRVLLTIAGLPGSEVVQYPLKSSRLSLPTFEGKSYEELQVDPTQFFSIPERPKRASVKSMRSYEKHMEYYYHRIEMLNKLLGLSAQLIDSTEFSFALNQELGQMLREIYKYEESLMGPREEAGTEPHTRVSEFRFGKWTIGFKSQDYVETSEKKASSLTETYAMETPAILSELGISGISCTWEADMSSFTFCEIGRK